jgi:hypothetical protein
MSETVDDPQPSCEKLFTEDAKPLTVSAGLRNASISMKFKEVAERTVRARYNSISLTYPQTAGQAQSSKNSDSFKLMKTK